MALSSPLKSIDPQALEATPSQQLSEAVDANFGAYVIRNFQRIKAILVAWVIPNIQTTVGAAGTASALPGQPEGYIIVPINGTNHVVPYYKAV